METIFCIAVALVMVSSVGFTAGHMMELSYLNRLYECRSCGKLHRYYQVETKVFTDENYKDKCATYPNGRLLSIKQPCPHCHSRYVNLLGESKHLKWMKYHPDCRKLSFVKGLGYKNMLSKLSGMEYDKKTKGYEVKRIK